MPTKQACNSHKSLKKKEKSKFSKTKKASNKEKKRMKKTGQQTPFKLLKATNASLRKKA